MIDKRTGTFILKSRVGIQKDEDLETRIGQNLNSKLSKTSPLLRIFLFGKRIPGAKSWMKVHSESAKIMYLGFKRQNSSKHMCLHARNQFDRKNNHKIIGKGCRKSNFGNSLIDQDYGVFSKEKGLEETRNFDFPLLKFPKRDQLS